MKLVALTGGIGSGKTVVSSIFNCLGVPIYNSDTEAKRIMNSNVEIRKQIIENFGSEVYENNVLQKQVLAQKIFVNQEAREIINKIVHPIVRQDFIKWSENQKSKYCILESALVFDTDLYTLFDIIIFVNSSIDTRVQRVMQRDNCTEEEILKRIKMQPSDEICLEKSHFVVENNNTFVIPQVIEIHQRILNNYYGTIR